MRKFSPLIGVAPDVAWGRLQVLVVARGASGCRGCAPLVSAVMLGWNPGTLSCTCLPSCFVAGCAAGARPWNATTGFSLLSRKWRKMQHMEAGGSSHVFCPSTPQHYSGIVSCQKLGAIWCIFATCGPGSLSKKLLRKIRSMNSSASWALVAGPASMLGGWTAKYARSSSAAVPNSRKKLGQFFPVKS